MTNSFQEEREAQGRAVSKLRALGARKLREPTDSTTTTDPMSSSIRPPPRPSRRKWVILAAAVTALVAVAVAASLVRRTGAANSDSTTSSTVTFEVSVEPDVPATIAVAGAVASGHPARARVQRDPKPVTIKVDSPGFEPTELTAPPDRDRLIAVRLVPRRNEAAPALPSAPVAAEVPPIAAPHAAPAAPQTRAKSAGQREPSAAPVQGAGKKRQDSLVTDYPF
jgi:hypothetical protein